MEELTNRNPSSETLDVDALRRRIRELKEIYGSSNDGSQRSSAESEQFIRDFALQFESTMKKFTSEFSDVGSVPIEDLDAYMGCLKTELNAVEAENAKISLEIEELTTACNRDSLQLESKIEELNGSLDFVGSQNVTTVGHADCSSPKEVELLHVKGDCKFKILELTREIDDNRVTLKALQDLDCVSKRFEYIEKIEDALIGLRVIEYEGNCIRLSLTTYFTDFENLLSQHKVEDSTEPLIHELLIEYVEGTMKIKNIEIFPSVFLGEIIEAANTFGQLSNVSGTGMRSSLEWVIRKVQDRIILCTLRRLLVKFANKSRHSYEYFDRDEMIVAHVGGGVDAFIKMPQSWPMYYDDALKLMSLKSSNLSWTEISLSFLCKVEEMANSLDSNVRANISSFTDAIEEILVQQMRQQLHSS